MNDIVVAAAKALGQELTDPVDLGGSSRSSVLRCRTGSGAGGSVIVKAYKDRSGFAAEAAGLAVCAEGPEPLAVDASFPFIVMSDLGDAPSLADALLGSSARQARDALRSWARTYGRIALAGAEREREFDDLRAKYSQGDDELSVFDRIGDPADWLPVVPDGLREEIGAVAESMRRYPVFSPGDICPDNNLLTPGGFRVLDFEGAGFHSAFLDAAYTRMPFATCWCVFRLPAEVSQEIEAVYRGEVVRLYPDLADDFLWARGVRHAVATWTMFMTAMVLPRARAEDRPMHRTRPSVPTWRQILRHRWRYLLAELDGGESPVLGGGELPVLGGGELPVLGGGELPVLGGVVRELLRETAGWDVAELPGYPAFSA
ncbi:phosphotransferase [Nonomuraea rhizosphaerae]|uniref:phosphotransferase n=1 Tax=Nonomuraea rhizosphaerae TaxID=2665663 RepID=UPI001C5F4A4D|nr:phosphotransferase [Nonomuraea rhizosphaerae]